MKNCKLLFFLLVGGHYESSQLHPTKGFHLKRFAFLGSQTIPHKGYVKNHSKPSFFASWDFLKEKQKYIPCLGISNALHPKARPTDSASSAVLSAVVLWPMAAMPPSREEPAASERPLPEVLGAAEIGEKKQSNTGIPGEEETIGVLSVCRPRVKARLRP